MKEPTYFVSADYEEFKPETYKGFVIEGECPTTNEFKVFLRFFTNNPQADFQAALRATKGRNAHYSPSVDNFVSDSGIEL